MQPDDKTTQPAAFIKLDQFLKLAQIVQSGGEAKHLIRSGQVWVNNVIETRRGRKLRHGDVVRIGDEELVVQVEPDESSQTNKASRINTRHLSG